MDSHTTPLVSIITPVYNSSKFIAECYASIISQEYQNWEWLLVDDQSTDNSYEIINEIAKDEIRMKVFQLPVNQGSGPARNLAIREAVGTYIAFLDSDDTWSNNKLSQHVSFMEQTDADFSHTSYGFTDEEGNRIRETFHVSEHPITYKDLLKRTEISCLTAMYNQKKIGKYFMPNLRRKQDYALWLSILKDGYVSIPLDEELAMYRQVQGSATHNKFKLIIIHFKFLYDVEKLSFFKALNYTVYWGINGLRKYYL